MKSSSKRRRRRARDSSLSPYSSDSEKDSRTRRKSSRREPKRPRRRSSRGDDRKRRGDPNKKKARKPRRHRDGSVSSTTSSGSSRSCSTCRRRSGSTGDGISRRPRSRSPDRKAKSRARGRDRARRSRYRSPSCSTCSGYSSRNSSPCEEKSREKRGRPRTKAPDHDREKIIHACDDFQPPRSNDGDVGRWREKKGQAGDAAAVGKDAPNSPGEDVPYKGEAVSSKANNRRAKKNDGGGSNSRLSTKDLSARKNSEDVASTLPAANSDDGRKDSLGRESGSIKDCSARKDAEVVASTGSLEAEDLELILRQKALENFRKLRGGLSTSSRSSGDRRDGSIGSESCKDAGRENAKGSAKSIECKPASSLENHRCTQVEGHPIEFGAKSVANPVTSGPNDNASSKLGGDHKITCSSDGRNTQIQVKKVHESSNKASSEQSSLSKDIQDTRGVAEARSSKVRGAEVNIADASAFGASCFNTETGNCKSDKPVAEATSGAQFEQKTFSRLHDGEMVQVSYKVYIPKKSPALARRQLQR